MKINRKAKRLAMAVKYDVNEYIHGRIDYVTDCPFGVQGRYTERTNKVGALECNICKHQIGNDTDARVVRCVYEKKQEVKKLFKD